MYDSHRCNGNVGYPIISNEDTEIRPEYILRDYNRWVKWRKGWKRFDYLYSFHLIENLGYATNREKKQPTWYFRIGTPQQRTRRLYSFMYRHDHPTRHFVGDMTEFFVERKRWKLFTRKYVEAFVRQENGRVL